MILNPGLSSTFFAKQAAACCLVLTASLRKISTLAAGDRVRTVDTNASGSPRAIADFVCRTIRQSIKRAKIGDHAIVGAGKIFQLLAFVEGAAAGVGQFLHLIMSQIESFLLDIKRA